MAGVFQRRRATRLRRHCPQGRARALLLEAERLFLTVAIERDRGRSVLWPLTPGHGAPHTRPRSPEPSHGHRAGSEEAGRGAGGPAAARTGVTGAPQAPARTALRTAGRLGRQAAAVLCDIPALSAHTAGSRARHLAADTEGAELGAICSAAVGHGNETPGSVTNAKLRLADDGHTAVRAEVCQHLRPPLESIESVRQQTDGHGANTAHRELWDRRRYLAAA